MLYSNGRAIICLYLIKKGIFKIEISIENAYHNGGHLVRDPMSSQVKYQFRQLRLFFGPVCLQHQCCPPMNSNIQWVLKRKINLIIIYNPNNLSIMYLYTFIYLPFILKIDVLFIFLLHFLLSIHYDRAEASQNCCRPCLHSAVNSATSTLTVI